MSTSGEYFSSPMIAESVDDAFERIGMDPEALTGRHMKSARRSLGLMLMDWANDADIQSLIERVEQPLVEGQSSFVLPDGSSDVLMANLKRGNDNEIMMVPLSRADWQLIVNKEWRGRPDRYFIEKRQSDVVFHFWQVEEQDNLDTVVYYRMRVPEHPGGSHNIPDMRVQFVEAITSGLAMKLAEKFSPSRLAEKAQLAAPAMQRALNATRERVDLSVSVGWPRSSW